MKFELNSHILIAHWIPGFLLVLAVRPILATSSSDALRSLMGSGIPGGDAMIALALIVAAFLAGEILDASRDLFEHLWDRFKSVSWDFFAEAEQGEVEKLRTSYFTYYVFDCNISLALVILMLSNIFVNVLSRGLLVAFFVILLVFAGNAWTLRGEIASRTGRWHRTRRDARHA
jgi:hypothetical protein